MAQGDAHQSKQDALIQRLQYLGQMASTETALFHQTAAATFGLGITDVKTVSALMQEGAMTAGQLAQRLSLTTGAITNVIDRLERQDLVRRNPDPADRRKVVVTANLEKLAQNDHIYRSVAEAFSQLLSTYTVEQLEFLVSYFEASIEITKQQIRQLAEQQR